MAHPLCLPSSLARTRVPGVLLLALYLSCDFGARTAGRGMGAFASVDECSLDTYLNNLVCGQPSIDCAAAGGPIDPNLGLVIIRNEATGTGLTITLGAIAGPSGGSAVTSAADCCTICNADLQCDAWQYSPTIRDQYSFDGACFLIKSAVCASSTTSNYPPDSLAFTYDDPTDTFGAGINGRCTAFSTIGELDPHFTIIGMSNETFTFDFHGLDQHFYCMITSAAIHVNVKMFGLPPTTRVLQRPFQDSDSFFEGTWMSGFGIIYANHLGERQSISVELDQGNAVKGQQPLAIATFGDGAEALRIDLNDGNTWSSPDGLASMTSSAEAAALTIIIADLLHMVVTVDTEEEIIANPPIYFLNFELKKISTPADVHGFLGQMYAPGAIEERLTMGTLEGFNHREYVEGTDDEYDTTSLTATDCTFNRFQGVPLIQQGATGPDGGSEMNTVLKLWSGVSRPGAGRKLASTDEDYSTSISRCRKLGVTGTKFICK